MKVYSNFTVGEVLICWHFFTSGISQKQTQSLLTDAEFKKNKLLDWSLEKRFQLLLTVLLWLFINNKDKKKHLQMPSQITI